jgi:ABC-type iron transport system FetAB permease component
MSISNSQPLSSPLATLLARWRAACVVVWNRKLLWLILFVALPVWLFLDYQWAGIPLAKTWQVVVVVLCGFVLLAVAGYALRVAFRSADWSAALRTVAGWTTLVVWALAGVWLPWRLLWLVFPRESIAAEATLAALRFALADALATGALLWLAAVFTPPPPPSGGSEGNPG